MRIAYIGNFEPEYSTENDVRKAFEHLGHEVIRLQENDASEVIKVREYNFDLLLITGTWDCTAEILAEYITMFKECAKRGIPTATLHLDTFWGTSRGGRRWWLHPMFHTAYIFTADGDYQKEWKLFGKNHIWLPPAVRHTAVGKGHYRKDYACDVAFVGSSGQGYHEDVWPYRKELVDNLRSMCERNGWSFKNPGGDDPKVNRNDDLNDFYASAKVTVGDSLCLSRENSRYWSDRVTEATGRNGLLVMPEIEALVSIYPQMPKYSWGDFKGLEELVDLLLDDEDLRTEVADSCFNITAADHTYVNRAQTILETVGLS